MEITMKEYLSNNLTPLFNDKINFLVLLWIEKEGMITTEKLVEDIGLSLKKMNQVICNLFINNLIQTNSFGHQINDNGVNALNKLGLRDVTVNKLMSRVKFKKVEKQLYKELLLNFRDISLDDYLNNNFYINYYTKSFENNNLNYNKNDYIISTFIEDESLRDTFIFILITISNTYDTIFKNFDKSASLFQSYIKLYNYTYNHNCFTKDIIEYLEKSLPQNLELSSDSFLISNQTLKYENKKNMLNFKLFLSKYNSLNQNIYFYNQFFNENKFFLETLMSSKSLDEIAIKSNISKEQASLIISNINQKCEELLFENKETD